MATNVISDAITTIRAALVSAGMFQDQVVVLAPNTDSATPYDPEADTGGESTPTLLLGPRGAYVKANANGSYSIQFVPEDGDPLITSGMIARVLPGGSNPDLVHYVFQVGEVPTGSIAPLTTLQTTTTSIATDPWVAP